MRAVARGGMSSSLSCTTASTLDGVDTKRRGCCKICVQELLGAMVDAVTNDYESLDYTTETAASVLGVLMVLSGASETIGLAAKVDAILDFEIQQIYDACLHVN